LKTAVPIDFFNKINNLVFGRVWESARRAQAVFPGQGKEAFCRRKIKLSGEETPCMGRVFALAMLMRRRFSPGCGLNPGHGNHFFLFLPPAAREKKLDSQIVLC
jgi:hypothetical protein